MFCTKCGKEIDENAKFCWHCGSPVESKAQKTQEVQSNIIAAKEAENIAEPVSKLRNRKKWVVPGAAAGSSWQKAVEYFGSYTQAAKIVLGVFLLAGALVLLRKYIGTRSSKT